jgi:hypothetical protein
MVVAGWNWRRQIFWQFVFLHGRNEDEGSAKFAPVELFASITSRRYNGIGMDDQNENPRRHQWPWFVLAAFLLGVALAIVWMGYAVHREKQERDLNAPLPGSTAR